MCGTLLQSVQIPEAIWQALILLCKFALPVCAAIGGIKLGEGFIQADNADRLSRNHQEVPMTGDSKPNDERFSLPIGLGLALGAGLGIAIGAAFGDVVFGSSMGAGIGLMCGVVYSVMKNKESDK